MYECNRERRGIVLCAARSLWINSVFLKILCQMVVVRLKDSWYRLSADTSFTIVIVLSQEGQLDYVEKCNRKLVDKMMMIMQASSSTRPICLFNRTCFPCSFTTEIIVTCAVAIVAPTSNDMCKDTAREFRDDDRQLLRHLQHIDNLVRALDAWRCCSIAKPCDRGW